MPFLGNQPSTGYSTIVKDDFTANGNDTVFTLSRTAASANSIAVFVGNVRQEPTDAYTVNGTTLTMSAAPANGANFYVLHISGAVENSSVPASGTIGTSQLANNAVHTGKIADNQITSAKLDTNIAIDGDLTVDTNTLYVDSTNNRVGIGTSSAGFGDVTVLRQATTATNVTLSLVSGTSGYGRLFFGDVQNTNAEFDGFIQYDQGNRLMQFGTAQAERMRIDSSGRVTMPYQPFFHAYGSGTSAAGTGSTVYAFSSTYNNVGNHYDTSTSRFTAPVAGNYMFCFMARIDGANTGYFRAYIQINGSGTFTKGHSIKDLGTNWDPGYYTFVGTTIYNLSANDYVDIAINSQSDTSITHYNSESSFYGILLS